MAKRGYHTYATATRAYCGATNEIDRTAFGVAGALGEFIADNPAPSFKECFDWLATSGRISETDWTFITWKEYQFYRGVAVARAILIGHRDLLLKLAELHREQNCLLSFQLCQLMI